ncbi:MAG: ATP-binding protein [Anaerolineales bacterium]|nr:ATP-binding protein [Anaerolineales bacterium]
MSAKPSNLLANLDSTQELTPELLTAAGEVLSRSTLFALRRNYLDGPILENQIMRVIEGSIPTSPDVAFFEVVQVGKPVDERSVDYFSAIQTSLAACLDPRYALIFAISSDGIRNRIYFGVTGRAPGTQPALFADQLGQFLCSNWPGTRVRMVEDYKEIADKIHVPLSTFSHARAFTGIPSSKTENTQMSTDPQTLDRLMRGMRGKPYLYLVLAEPLPESRVADTVDACNSLSGQIHGFIKTTLSMGRSTGTSETVSTSESESSSTSTSRSESSSDSESKSKGVLGSAIENSSGAARGLKLAGMGGVAALLTAAGGPFLLSGMMGMFGQLLPSTSDSSSSSESLSESESLSRSVSSSTSGGATTGESMTFGQEVLNKHAEECTRLLSETVSRFEVARSQGCWNVGVYLLSDQAESVSQAQAQLKALVSGHKSAFEPVRVHRLDPVWDGQVQVALDAFTQPRLILTAPEDGQPIEHPLGNLFQGLTTPLNTEELSLLVNLPRREMPGLSVQSTASFSLNPPELGEGQRIMRLGNVLEGGEEIGELPYNVDLDALTRHVFITGITGSGKSNTCRRFIEELLHNQVNFMIIEPAKDEYVRLALGYNASGMFEQKIAIYMPGRDDWGGQQLQQLHINPFDIIRLKGAHVNVMPHMDRLKSIFNASFPMYEILPVILEEGLVDLYESQGWLEEKLPPDGVGAPMVSQLHARIGGLVADKGYEERITSNITAALKTRLSSLMRGWKGNLFDHAFSTPWADLFDRPVVINLSQMGDDADKCLTMALILNFLYEYRQAQHEAAGSPESATLQHLAIFEEAHRVLRAAPRGAAGDANPAAKMGEMFADILAEIRAYGQGLGIIDQVPSKLVPDALKNTNLKIVHRLVAADDRDAMANALALTEDQPQIIARLKVGQAIISGIQDDMASWVKIFYTPLPEVKQK